jgi:flavin reductase (DIM6/NTAB) family NADH-FMN oxidoreductase RutF
MGISPHEFRHILSYFASGVTIVTTREEDGRPSGLTASAFASVSLDPPLVLVCVDRSAQSYPALLACGHFAVNILTSEQEPFSRRFATKRDDKFEGVGYQSGQLGMPVLDGALAVLECRTVYTYAGGDHTIFVGEVEAADAGRGSPLLYYRGQYQQLNVSSSQPLETTLPNHHDQEE